MPKALWKVADAHMPQSEPKDKLLRVKSFWEKIFHKRTRNKIPAKITLPRKSIAEKNILLSRNTQTAAKHVQHSTFIQYLFVESGNFLKTQFAIFREKNIFQSQDATAYLQINYRATVKSNTFQEIAALLMAHTTIDAKSAWELYLQTPNREMDTFLSITPKMIHNFEFLRFLVSKGVFSEDEQENTKTKYIQDIELLEPDTRYNIYNDEDEDEGDEEE